MAESYETHAKGIRILPGQWRPHYRFEQIAWVSPPWPSQDYVWLDFPEAIFSSVGLIYLSHVNPDFPVLFPDLPRRPWQTDERGISYERTLPDGLAFGGSVRPGDGSTVALSFHILNGSGRPIENIMLQTCAYLRGIKEFSDFTLANKFVHLPQSGWLPFDQAEGRQEPGSFHLGWRGGLPSADLPVMVATSNQAQRLVAMTWYASTFSLVANPDHPCMHADPLIPELGPGQRKEIRGELIFFEGTLEAFGGWFSERWECRA